jgi:hypothetical protein
MHHGTTHLNAKRNKGKRACIDELQGVLVVLEKLKKVE